MTKDSYYRASSLIKQIEDIEENIYDVSLIIRSIENGKFICPRGADLPDILKHGIIQNKELYNMEFLGYNRIAGEINYKKLPIPQKAVKQMLEITLEDLNSKLSKYTAELEKL